jgi:hypothetical protein
MFAAVPLSVLEKETSMYGGKRPTGATWSDPSDSSNRVEGWCSH